MIVRILKSIININSKNNANAKALNVFNSKNTENVGYNNELFLTFQQFFLKIYLEKEMQGNYTKAILKLTIDILLIKRLMKLLYQRPCIIACVKKFIQKIDQLFNW